MIKKFNEWNRMNENSGTIEKGELVSRVLSSEVWKKLENLGFKKISGPKQESNGTILITNENSKYDIQFAIYHNGYVRYLAINRWGEHQPGVIKSLSIPKPGIVSQEILDSVLNKFYDYIIKNYTVDGKYQEKESKERNQYIENDKEYIKRSQWAKDAVKSYVNPKDRV